MRRFNQRGANRRDFLRQCCLGVGTLSLPNILRLRAEAATKPSRSETSLILLWQDGGPSHFETFDPKPDAPAEIRGELGAIPTSLPGVQFCEVLPRLAQLANRLAIIRSLHQPSSDHVVGSRIFITGYDQVEPGPSIYPDLGAIVHRIRDNRAGTLPEYIALGGKYTQGLHRGGPGYLGPSYGPFTVSGDPGQPDFRVESLKRHPDISRERFDERMRLARMFQTQRDDADPTGAGRSLDRFHRMAQDLLSSSSASQAFDLDQENRRTRDRYGRHTAGQQALLARRLVEAGVSVVAVRFCPDGRGDGDQSGVGWDDHAVHGNIFKIMQRRGPQFDQAVSALVEDLHQRGLDQQVLLVVAGEFGRTPRISYANGDTFNTGHGPGRDHWGNAGCALVFGGGMPMGQVIGATNRLGESPIERAAQPQDLLATIYRFLGINPRHEFVNRSGRPIPLLPFGEPIAELNG